jgi:hypothetical protein
MFQFYVSAEIIGIIIINLFFGGLSTAFLWGAYKIRDESKALFYYFLIIGVIFGSVILILDLELAQIISINIVH